LNNPDPCAVSRQLCTVERDLLGAYLHRLVAAVQGAASSKQHRSQSPVAIREHLQEWHNDPATGKDPGQEPQQVDTSQDDNQEKGKSHPAIAAPGNANGQCLQVQPLHHTDEHRRQHHRNKQYACQNPSYPRSKQGPHPQKEVEMHEAVEREKREKKSEHDHLLRQTLAQLCLLGYPSGIE